MQCLFCHSSNISKAAYPRPTRFNNKQFNYHRCGDCGLIFIDPVPDADDYNKMYAESYHNQFYFNETPDYSDWLALFGKYSKEKSIVDYGCGDGGFLKFFKSRGYEGTGVEYDPELVSRLRKENPEMIFYTVEEFWKLDQQFNAFFMGDVLEHMAKPAECLGDLMKKLKQGGLIAAQGPLEDNANLALRFRKLVSVAKTGTGNPAIASHVPYHIFFSNARNQKAVFEDSGLQTKYYKVIETPWPFPPKMNTSPGDNLKHLIAKTSIFLSQSLPGKMGNRFLYVGEKK
jgi:2-polyprenyl-3-methyl-5-hydroxy-6-metoxy-1,4-benzoquinol methylase